MAITFRKLLEGETVIGCMPKSKQHNAIFDIEKIKEGYAIIQDQSIIGLAYPEKKGYNLVQLDEQKGWVTTSYKKCDNINNLIKLLNGEK